MAAESGLNDLSYGPRQERTLNFVKCLLKVIGMEPACVIPGMKLFETHREEKAQTIVEIQSDGSYILIAEQAEAKDTGTHSEAGFSGYEISNNVLIAEKAEEKYS